MITRIECGTGNCFIIGGENGAVLVDTSVKEYRDKIHGVCKDKNIKLIALTHGHWDHTQNAAYLSKTLNAPIAMHKADYGLITNNMDEPMSADKFWGKRLLSSVKQRIIETDVEPFEPEVFLSDGDTLDAFGAHAEVIGLPGHTKGSIGFYDGSGIIVGDALMNIILPTKSLLYGNKTLMDESVEKICSYASATVHFGHGKSIANRKKWT